jgi:sugar phosphate isomerase/epimerase
MKNLQTRMQRNLLFLITGFLTLTQLMGINYNANAQKLHPDDWKLGIQAWTFHLNTFAEALDKINECGVKYVEAFPPQKIGAGIAGTMDYHMDAATREKVLALLHSKGIKMVSYGVVNPETDSDWVQLFKFAKAMGLKNIVSEPQQSQIPFISKLSNEYKINVAIHDHARPTRYWNPDIVLTAIKGASPRIGSCADIGHWLESGLDPVECMKKLKGHIIEFHLKDENMKGTDPGFHDVPLGEGVIDMAGIMKEMKRQHFKGYCFIEYEYHFENNVPDVKTCVKYFRDEKEKLLK